MAVARPPRARDFAFGVATIFTAASHLEPIFEPVIEQAGFRLVRLRIMGGGAKTLQIMAERADGSMDVEGCTRLSHALLDFIESEDPIEGEYEIEVSSPGIDRPLTRLSDFSRWKGHEAKIELSAPLPTPNGERKRFRGVLGGLDGNDVVIVMAEGNAQFPFRAIVEAKLVLTDKLIQEDLKAKKNTQDAGAGRQSNNQERV